MSAVTGHKLHRNKTQRGMHGSVSHGNLPSQAMALPGSHSRPPSSRQKIGVFENPHEAEEAHEADFRDYGSSATVKKSFG